MTARKTILSWVVIFLLAPVTPAPAQSPSVCIGPQQKEHFRLAVNASRESLASRGMTMTIETNPNDGRISTEIISPNGRARTYADPCTCPSPVPVDPNQHLNLNIAQIFENPFHMACLFPMQIQRLMRETPSSPDEPRFSIEKIASGSFVNLSNIPQTDADQLRWEHPSESDESGQVGSPESNPTNPNTPPLVDNVFHPINVILNSDRVYSHSSEPKVSVRIFIPDCGCDQPVSRAAVNQLAVDSPTLPANPPNPEVPGAFPETAPSLGAASTPNVSTTTIMEPTQQNNPAQQTQPAQIVPENQKGALRAGGGGGFGGCSLLPSSGVVF